MTIADRIRGETKQYRNQRVLMGEVEGDLSDGSVKATGGSTFSTLADWMAGVPSVALVGTGVAATDTAAIQAALEDIGGEGGGILKLKGTFSINDTIVHQYPNVLVLGDGADDTHDVGGQGAQASTALTWSGSAGGTLMTMSSIEGASAQKLRGGGVVGIRFGNGATTAAKGLEILSWQSAIFEDLFFGEFSTSGLSVGCVSTLGEAKDTQKCVFRRIRSRFINESGASIVLDGVSDANTSMNLFEDIDLVHYNGEGISLKNCDNNLFLRTRVFRASGGSGIGVAFHGSNDAVGRVARNNVFILLTAQDITAYGTGTYTYASHDNATLWLDNDNGISAPSIGTGASCSYSFPDGRLGDHALIKGIAAATESGADYARSLYAAGGTSSLIVVNDAQGHAIWSTGDGTSRWTQRLITGDMDFTLVAGVAATAALRVPRVRIGSGGPTWGAGSGSPEGVVTAVIGSIYSRTDGGASTTLYVKESGTGNTGWKAVQTA